MRLSCPSCGAKYDVADDAIPEGGRDVQCSNCNHSWFHIEKTSAPAPTVAPAAQQARKPIDPAVSDILRQEAAREKQLRTSGTKTPRQTQEDKTPKPAPDAAETRRRIAEMTEAAGDGGTAPAPKAAKASRDIAAGPAPEQPSAIAPDPSKDPDTTLPDMPSMNDINTSLRTRAQAPEPELTPAEQAEAITRRGFRRGFVFVLMIFAVLFGPYVFADQITASIPQSADAMASYVSMVDGWRLTLNQTAGALGDMIADVTAGPDSQPDQN